MRSVFVILRAFAGGCSALTGVEAISNGVQVFRPPESRNAAQTLAVMALLLGMMFVGVSHLAQASQVVYAQGQDQESVLSLIARTAFHDNDALRATVLFSKFDEAVPLELERFGRWAYKRTSRGNRMASDTYHEPLEILSVETREMHRAIVSLMEELEAIDWYQQRADACSDPQLKDVLLHNKKEEIEHATMVMEWIRRHSDHFNQMMRKYLFTEQPITGIEKGTGMDGPAGSVTETLSIGSMKGR